MEVQEDVQSNQNLVADLEEEYLQQFDLDQLHPTAAVVKREDKKMQEDAEMWSQQDDSSSRVYTQWEDERRPRSPHAVDGSMYGGQPMYVNVNIVNDPSTPPETPPSHSPGVCRPQVGTLYNLFLKL